MRFNCRWGSVEDIFKVLCPTSSLFFFAGKQPTLCVLNGDFTPAAIFSAHHLGDFVHLALLSSVGCIFCLASKFIRICSFISSCHSLNSSVSLCTGAYNAPVTCLTWCLVISSSEYVDSRWLLTLPVLSTSSSLLPFSCLAALCVYG